MGRESQTHSISLRAKLARLCARWLIKRGGTRSETLVQTRQRFRSLERLIPSPPRGTEISTIEVGTLEADYVVTPVSRADRHVLYLHGGAYRLGSRALARHFTWRIASAARARLIAVDYRLAPEHPFPCALDDAVASYRWLLDGGFDPRRTIIFGESAGGGLALGLLLKLRDCGLPLPVAAVALSPWTDLALTGATLAENAAADPMIHVADLPGFAADYLAGADARNPYASPLYGNVTGLPPVLIQVGGDEVLLDDALRMAEKLRLANSPVELQTWPQMFHTWQLFVPILPEAHAAIAKIGQFVQRTLDE